MKDFPKITVLMSVYNGEEYIAQAIESILDQTYRDFEFLIIDDGSTDKSIEIIKSFNDDRIKLIQNSENLGLSASLNRGIDLAQGEYIARMDIDDISLPQRLEKQVKFLDSHPNIAVCGTLIKTFGNVNPSVFRYYETSDLIKSALIFKCPLAHPTVMIRKASLKNCNIYYNPSYTSSQDYELWSRLTESLNFHNIQEVLLLYRMHAQQTSQYSQKDQTDFSRAVMLNQLDKLGIKPTDEELELHQQIGAGKIQPSKEFVNRAESWLLRLKEVNNKNKHLPEHAFSYVIAEQWFLVCIKAAKLGVWSCWKFFSSPLSKKNDLSIKSKIKLISRCLKPKL